MSHAVGRPRAVIRRVGQPAEGGATHHREGGCATSTTLTRLQDGQPRNSDTGLRKNELASLTVAQAKHDGPVLQLELNAADEKNREGNGVLIRDDLADDLRHWLADKLGAPQATPGDAASRSP